MRKPSLLTQILAVNTLLITATVLAAVAVAQLDLGDADTRRQAMILTAGILATILVDAMVLRRRLQPLERLTEVMERVDLAQPGERAQVPEADSADVVRLHHAFNRMLDRLEAERAHTASAVLRAQEEERARLARDLHDEANQSLTGVLLRLQACSQDAPEPLRSELRATQQVANEAMEELLRLARELRPTALDDHGLAAALRAQVDRFSDQTGIDVDLELGADAETLGDDEQIVVYRVIQESLSNIARHADAGHVRVELTSDDARPLVRVGDDGRGFNLDAPTGLGLTGMRERARLAGGRVDVHSVQGHGTTVELRLERAA